MIRPVGLPSIIATVLAAHAVAAPVDPYALDWVRTDFFGRRDLAAGVVVNSQDEPIVAGATGAVYGSSPNLGGQVATVARFSPAGQQQWTTPAYPSEQLDHVMGMDIDQNGNVFIAGETYRYQGAEAYLVKYSPQGSVLWERHLGTSDNEFGRDVAVDSAGNAYLLGSTTGILTGSTSTGYDAFIARYSPTGIRTLLRQYVDDAVSNIPSAIDEKGGDLFVVGTKGAHSSTLTRLNSAGDVLWSINPSYATLPGQGTQLYDLAIGSDGSIYTCGFTDTVYDNALGFQGSDAVLAKHGPDGALLWQHRLDTGENDRLSAIHIDSFGDVYVAGSRTDAQSIIVGDFDAVWARFSPQCDLLWQEELVLDESQYFAAISVDSQRNVYLAGSGFWNANGYVAGDGDAVLVRYSFGVPEPSTAGLLLSVAALVAVLRRAPQRHRAHPGLV